VTLIFVKVQVMFNRYRTITICIIVKIHLKLLIATLH